MEQIIDMHVHPVFYKPICDDPEELEFRKNTFGVWKQGPMDWDEIFAEMDYGGITQSVLLPLDATTTEGGCIVTNEQAAKLQKIYPDRLIAFASVDPHRQDAKEALIYAFDELGLNGLKLHPSKQKFYPADARLEPLYEICESRNKPIIFHAGTSWEPNTPAKFAHPLAFEEIFIRHPQLRCSLSHFAWPWVREMVMLLIKYPNVYTDTSVLFMDSPEESMKRLFAVDMGEHWFARGFQRQVMFASNTPRFRAFKLKRALDAIPMREAERENLYYRNALRFLKGEE